MAEQNEQLDSTPENSPKRLEYWTDQEVKKFVDALGLIKAEWQMVEALDAPYITAY